MEVDENIDAPQKEFNFGSGIEEGFFFIGAQSGFTEKTRLNYHFHITLEIAYRILSEKFSNDREARVLFFMPSSLYISQDRILPFPEYHAKFKYSRIDEDIMKRLLIIPIKGETMNLYFGILNMMQKFSGKVKAVFVYGITEICNISEMKKGEENKLGNLSNGLSILKSIFRDSKIEKEKYIPIFVGTELFLDKSENYGTISEKDNQKVLVHLNVISKYSQNHIVYLEIEEKCDDNNQNKYLEKQISFAFIKKKDGKTSLSMCPLTDETSESLGEEFKKVKEEKIIFDVVNKNLDFINNV